MNIRRTIALTVITAASCAAGSGCLGYRLGATLPPDIHTVHVPLVVNRCGEPDIEDDVTSEIVSRIQREGTLSITSEDRADAILDVTLTHVTLVPLRYARDRATEAVEFRLLLGADMILKDRATGKTLSRNKVEGRTTFESEGDIPGGRLSAMPAAARDLASRVVETAFEAW